MNESLIAINISINNKIINNIPLLFYWNGENTLIDSFKHDLKVYLDEKNLININTYGESKIYFFKILINNETESYEDNEVLIQDIYTLQELDLNLSYTIIYKICLDLYKKCYKTNFNNLEMDKIETIDYIYNILKEKYKNKLSDITFLNYIRSELSKSYSLKNNNIDYIISLVSGKLLEK